MSCVLRSTSQARSKGLHTKNKEREGNQRADFGIKGWSQESQLGVKGTSQELSLFLACRIGFWHAS